MSSHDPELSRAIAKHFGKQLMFKLALFYGIRKMAQYAARRG